MIHYIYLIFEYIAGLTIFNWLHGYRRGAILIDFEERYNDHQKQIAAIITELASQGREVDYVGYRQFEIDGKLYIEIKQACNPLSQVTCLFYSLLGSI
ncbi:hypothetical protein [Pontibacillus yanchengensis]|uniref:Uncharacterized protein n=1 Tax=Pontibacillus yanchengensis Y32 TaxID=1385514 RepID=A0A0A2TD67_9BACI|nr:hypothetical protein [Pontibacillus yanchengensis]KGP72046.1 hypothetical protein N782_14295 [Pontibacillus yanchengensis Y32]